MFLRKCNLHYTLFFRKIKTFERFFNYIKSSSKVNLPSRLKSRSEFILYHTLTLFSNEALNMFKNEKLCLPGVGINTIRTASYKNKEKRRWFDISTWTNNQNNSRLFYSQVSVYTGVSCRSCQVFIFPVWYMLFRVVLSVFFG